MADTAPQISPSQINQRLTAIAARTTTLQYETENLSYAALTGDATATDKLEAIKAERAQISAEAETLENALASAERLERSVFDGIAAQRRATAEALAKSLATEMIQVSDEIEALYLNGFLPLLRRLQELEPQIKRPLLLLGMQFEGRTGQGELAVLARDLFRERRGYEETPSLSAIARNAWREIAPEETE